MTSRSKVNPFCLWWIDISVLYLGLFDVLSVCKKGSVLSELRRAQSDVTDSTRSVSRPCPALPVAVCMSAIH